MGYLCQTLIPVLFMGIKTPMRCLIKFYLFSKNLVNCELIYHHLTSLYTFVDCFFSIFMDVDSTNHHKCTRTLSRTGRVREALMQHVEVRVGHCSSLPTLRLSTVWSGHFFGPWILTWTQGFETASSGLFKKNLPILGVIMFSFQIW